MIDLSAPELPLLLDWKTSRRVRAEEYAVQVSIYAEALRSLGLPAPDEAHLVYVAAREIVTIPATPIDTLVDEFRRAHRGAGAFPAVPGHSCLHCDFRKACLADGVECPSTQPLPGMG